MFEFDKYDPARHPDPARPSAPYTPFGGGARRAFLLWGEHCTECAAPACYESCDLYAARPDQRCRRFEFGAFRNPAFPCASGAGAEVLFKRWGKIEARGNARLLPSGLVHVTERAAGLAAPALDAAGSLVRRLSGDKRWSHLAFALSERANARLHKRGGGAIPDAFVLELYNPGAEPVTLLFSAAVDRSGIGRAVSPAQLPRPVLERVVVAPGYFRRDIAGAAFAEILSSGLPFNLAVTPEGTDGVRLVFLTLDFVAFESRAGEARPTPSGTARPVAKCVVFDLDNTLWDGVLLEGAVALRPAVLETIRQLDERGILISIASKNAAEDAAAQLRAFGLEAYLLCPAIGWGPKSQGLRDIARRLDIGIDSLIFVDDNPFERDEVAKAVPEVEVLPDSALASLLDHPRLQGAVTAESRTRRQMYRESLERETASAAYGADYVEFLRSCHIRLHIRRDRREDFERVCELVQRTNQLNFSGRKYRREEIEAILGAADWERWVIGCEDRYGSYGIVGFCLARRQGTRLWIEDLMLSCRVQGKYIERALLHALAVRGGWKAESIGVNFQASERNVPARLVLTEMGFRESAGGGMALESVGEALRADFVSVALEGDTASLAAE
jgi:FkbH-like protein